MVERLRARLRDSLKERVSNTRYVKIEKGAILALPDLMERASLWRRVLLVADARTYEAAGEKVHATLSAAGAPTTTLILDPDCVRDEYADQVAAEIRRVAPVTPVAVGAGTINDTVKLAAETLHMPYVAVATAPSMNGYPSSISAVLRDGLKCTVPASPPVAILYDLDVMTRAPREMIGSGYADLLAKPTSESDWILARELVGDRYEEAPLQIIEGVTEEVVRRAEQIRDAAEIGLEALCLGLTLSGLSMAAAGSSQPASGAEHLISHFWDMIGHRDGWTNDLHGRQVGVSCIMMAKLFEKLLALGPSDMRPADAPCDALALESAVREVYGSLAEPALGEFIEKSPDPESIARRVDKASQRWEALRREVGGLVSPTKTMRENLKRGGAPTTLAEIGRTPEEGRLALVWCRAMRRRYTSLDLAAELGRLESWADEIVAEVS